MDEMDSTVIFQIKDADTDIKATAAHRDGSDLVTIMSPDRDAYITLSLADFRRLVASVDRHF